MRTRRTAITIAAVLLAACLLYFLVLPANPKTSSPRLRVVRHVAEGGREIVFFRVELADSRRVQICGAEKIIGDKVESPFVEGSFPMQVAQNFWAASQAWPMGDFRRGRQEFGVLAPTNTIVWKFRVRVCISMPRSSAWLTTMQKDWMAQRRRGISFLKATRDTWNTFYSMGTEEIESECITNSVPAV